MIQESTGQVWQLCRDRIARPEALCLSIYLCDECATMPVESNRENADDNFLSKQRQQADDNTIK